MTTPTHDAAITDDADDFTISRRGWGKHLLLSASALAVLFASDKPATVRAASTTDTWKLGGNANVDKTNFIGPTNSAPLIIKTAGIERMRVTASGNVGIGNASPTARLLVDVANGVAIHARHTATSGDAAAVRGETNSTVTNAAGVYGAATNTGAKQGTAGVSGNHAGTGYGVQGTATNGTGVYGTGETGIKAVGTLYGAVARGSEYGVYGNAGGTGQGVIGQGKTGVSGTSSVTDGVGVYGSGTIGVNAKGTSTGVSGEGPTGVRGKGDRYGVFGSADTHGVYGIGMTGVYGFSQTDYGVHGESATSGTGVFGFSASGNGVYGFSSGGNGVYGKSPNNVGVSGEGGIYGLVGKALGTTGSTYGIFAQSNANGWAGYFDGYVRVDGTLSKSSGSFQIDHPLDPANKYLYHSFVESPDMMNIYNGNVALDAKGEAVVTLPAWFEALNMEFRYQLTAIGAPGPNLYIAAKIKGNQFKIAGGTTGMEVSWQVTGIRQDAYANAHRIPIEETKPAPERGRYIHPEVFGKPASMSIAALHGLPNGASTQGQSPSDTVQPTAPDTAHP